MKTNHQEPNAKIHSARLMCGAIIISGVFAREPIVLLARFLSLWVSLSHISRARACVRAWRVPFFLVCSLTRSRTLSHTRGTEEQAHPGGEASDGHQRQTTARSAPAPQHAGVRMTFPQRACRCQPRKCARPRGACRPAPRHPSAALPSHPRHISTANPRKRSCGAGPVPRCER